MKNRTTKTKESLSSFKSEHEKPAAKMSMLEKLINLLIHLTLMAITGLIIFRTVKNAGLVLYSVHPVLMSVGYLILMSNGILSMADNNILTQSLSHQKRVTTHWVIQAVAMVLITIGQTAIYVNKDLNGWAHYQSTHSLFGLVTYLLALGATLGGTLTKYSFQLKSFVKPAMLKVGHGFAGIVVYVLAVATIFLGLNQSWTDYGDMQLKFGILGAFLATTVYVISKSFKLTLSRAGALSKK